MSSKSKAELLAEAQSKGLQVTEESSRDEIRDALKNAQGGQNQNASQSQSNQQPKQNTKPGPVSTSSGVTNKVSDDPVNSDAVANKPEYGNAVPNKNGRFNSGLDDGTENK